jgi:hypothetical protein
MKQTKHKNQILIFVITILFAGHGYAQDDCQVNLEAIAGSYEGGCKKGLAEGQGTAKGVDSYVGEFKKGLPHGTGTYTWANGDVYTGEFKKGRKEGAGKLLNKQIEGQVIEQKGFWKNDEYIGESKTPYEVMFRSSNVLSIRITEMDNPSNDGDALFVEIQHKGRTQPAPDFGLNVTNGNFQNRFMVGNANKILVTTFPFGFTISYMGETVEIQVYQAKSWKILVDFNK